MSVGLTFPGELKDESVICYISKNFNININIIEASFSTSSGWAILGIEGEKQEIVVLTAGESCIIPPNHEHEQFNLVDSVTIDAWSLTP